MEALGINGITPAYAGNTYVENFLKGMTGDHPRLRGEHNAASPKDLAKIGSPPPTRGTLLIVESLPMRPGITPAYAGNTVSHKLEDGISEDHPRLRGEHTLVSLF